MKTVKYKWVVLSNTTLGSLMASLDSNIVLIALPTIPRDLPHATLFSLLWIIIGYQLVTASVLINFGRLADIFGRVRLYNLGFAIFTIGSALCSLSQTSDELIAFRLVQGVGAGFLFSNSAAIITDTFPINERGMALGINQISIVVGSVFGLVMGGFLTSFAGWRSIFLVNIPIGIFATVWAHYKLKELANIQKKEGLDILGNVTFAGGVALLLTGITLNILSTMSFDSFLLMTVSGVALLIAFIFVERRTLEPMFDLSIFKIRLFAAGNAAIFINSLARGTVSIVLVFYLQGPSMNLSPLVAGIFLLPISISMAALGPVSGWLSDRYGARGLSTLGLIVSAMGFLLLARIGLVITFTHLMVPLILIGAGMGLFASPNRASIMNSVKESRRGVASGTSTTLVNIESTFSMALAFSVLAVGTPLKDLEGIFLGQKVGGNATWIYSFINSIHSVYYLSAVLILIAIIPSVLRGKPLSH